MPGPTSGDLPPGDARGPSADWPSGGDMNSADIGANAAQLSANSADVILDPAAASLDPPEPGMWLTASAWLPAALLDAVQAPEPAGNARALAAALSQGGPLDAFAARPGPGRLPHRGQRPNRLPQSRSR
jgi:hypothetical protein